MLEKTMEISVLYDYYNQLLTEKQSDIVDLYYNQDLSLGEIAEQFNISRQAVYDMLKRTENLLYQYEEKLGIIKLMQFKNEKIESVLTKVIQIEDVLKERLNPDEISKQLDDIKNELNSFLNN